MTGLLVAVLLLAGLTAAAEPIRVALGEGYASVEVETVDLVTVRDGSTRRPLFGIPGGRVIRIVPERRGLHVAWGPSSRERRPTAVPAVRLETRRGSLRVGRREYEGALEVWRNRRGLLLVNELPLEEYIAGTVRAEAGRNWPAEALRAVAVVARTYAVFLQQRAEGKLYHLLASSQDQNYAGHVRKGSSVWKAVRATTGQVLTWQGRVFPTFYHSDSGGFTEPPQAVFSGDGVPPLPGVRDEFSDESPNRTWAVTLPLETVGQRLRRAGFGVGTVAGLTVLERSPSLRVLRIAVTHSRGTTTFKGTEFRRALGFDVLKSTLFVPVTGSDGMVRFEGRGWGHGVGLSQFGAKGMADRGYTYARILAYYYPGTALRTLR